MTISDFGINSEDFVSYVETLSVFVTSPARVVINERTGTVVIGGAVRLLSCAVAHGDLEVRISAFPEISQPLPFSNGGQTSTVWQDSIFVSEEKGRIWTLGGESTVSELVQGLNAVGASPRDVVAIFQAIRKAGALKAELVVM
jgi:flagellar P-ring protein precursor FlgI